MAKRKTKHRVWMRQKCNKCGITKGKTQFSLHPTRKSGLRAWCKQCNMEYQRARRAKLKAEAEAERKRQARVDAFNNAAPTLWGRLWQRIKGDGKLVKVKI